MHNFHPVFLHTNKIGLSVQSAVLKVVDDLSFAMDQSSYVMLILLGECKHLILYILICCWLTRVTLCLMMQPYHGLEIICMVENKELL